MTLQICPVCGKEYQVGPARKAVAWGRQLACSCSCELEHRRRVRQRLLDACRLRAADAGEV